VADEATRAAPTGLGARLKRAGLLALMAIVGLNIWTGSPLMALWLGSRVVGDDRISMGAVAVVVIAMVTFSVLLIRLLAALSQRYERLTVRPPARRQPAPWMRSMRAERVTRESARAQVTALDVVLVGVVLLAIGAFEVWFFFFSGAPI
jgi:hypothetical protein